MKAWTRSSKAAGTGAAPVMMREIELRSCLRVSGWSNSFCNIVGTPGKNVQRRRSIASTHCAASKRCISTIDPPVTISALMH